MRQEIPRFDQQGEFAGKKKGRKPKTDTDPASSSKAVKTTAKAKGSAKAKALPSKGSAAGPKARPVKAKKAKKPKGKAAKKAVKSKPALKAKPKASRNSGARAEPDAGEVELEPIPRPAVKRPRKAAKRHDTDSARVQDHDDCFKPPQRVTLNHVYSSAYRKALSGNGDVEFAKAQARKATKLFSESGLVNGLCGQFRAARRAANCD